MAGLQKLLSCAAREKSVLTKSFWFGKFLQQLPEVGGGQSELRTENYDTEAEHFYLGANSPESLLLGKPLYACIQEASECLKQCDTSLSPTVFQLIVRSIADLSLEANKTPVSSSDCDSILVKDNCTLNWDEVAKILGEDMLCEKVDYTAGARRCIEISRRIHTELIKNPGLISQLQKQENFEWTQSPKLLSECVMELQLPEKPLRKHTCLLLGTAALERALGDVYLTVSQSTQCPLLLRDLLATPELETTFGETTMWFLRCVIGPPSGLNLRNVLWHGFVAHTEIPVEYVFMLFVVASSLGCSLKMTQPNLQLQHRPYLTFPQEVDLVGVFEVFSDEDLVVVEKLFSESYFILPSMLPTWIAALEEFRTKRFSHFIVLMLPMLEHSLRRVFACVNGCPERTLTAESTTFYTTFDEILSPVLSTGDTNKLKEEIGTAKLEMLLDLLVHPEGPRIRDRISHGEVDFYSISRTLSNHVLSVAVVFCMEYSLSRSLLEAEPLIRCQSVEQNYVSIFHPFSLLRKELEQLVLKLNKWKEIPEPDYWQSHEQETETIGSSPSCKTTGKNDLSALTSQVLGHLHYQCGSISPSTLERTVCEDEPMKLIAHIWSRPLETLYVARHDLELAGCMRRIVENTHRAVSQIMETALVRHRQYVEKQLRSRQRNNYDHLLGSLNLYQDTMVLLTSLLITTTSQFSHKAQETHQKTIKLQKKVLQFSENFYSQSSPTKNRWEEADKLCLNLAELVRKQVTVLARAERTTR